VNPKLKRNIYKVLPFGIIWLILSWLFLWIEYAVITSIGEAVPDSAITLTPQIVLFASVSIFFIGCFVGILEVIYINRFFDSKSFRQKLFGKTLVYFVLIFLITFVFFLLAASIELGQPVYSDAVFNKYKIYFFSITNVSTIIQLIFSILISVLYAEISDNIGQQVIFNFFTGKYHKPVLEERVFMFIDMKDSTPIAEQLGHKTYFEFLKSYYKDLSDAIIFNRGEVYQYIGDEVVISWPLYKKNAVLNALNCFFDMKRSLAKRSLWYMQNYKVAPDFKGAVHAGEVTIGEIGALKKDIFFTGDVLNTTSRIQSLCSTFNADLLVSEDVYTAAKKESAFQFDHINEVALKGKTKPVKIYAVTSGRS